MFHHTWVRKRQNDENFHFNQLFKLDCKEKNVEKNSFDKKSILSTLKNYRVDFSSNFLDFITIIIYVFDTKHYSTDY